MSYSNEVVRSTDELYTASGQEEVRESMKIPVSRKDASGKAILGQTTPISFQVFGSYVLANPSLRPQLLATDFHWITSSTWRYSPRTRLGLTTTTFAFPNPRRPSQAWNVPRNERRGVYRADIRISVGASKLVGSSLLTLDIRFVETCGPP